MVREWWAGRVWAASSRCRAIHWKPEEERISTASRRVAEAAEERGRRRRMRERVRREVVVVEAIAPYWRNRKARKERLVLFLAGNVVRYVRDSDLVGTVFFFLPTPLNFNMHLTMRWPIWNLKIYRVHIKIMVGVLRNGHINWD